MGLLPPPMQVVTALAYRRLQPSPPCSSPPWLLPWLPTGLLTYQLTRLLNTNSLGYERAFSALKLSTCSYCCDSCRSAVILSLAISFLSTW